MNDILLNCLIDYSDWTFPIPNKVVGITCDSDSFKKIDISKEVEIPIIPHVGSFGAERKFDVHKGIDLYANIGTPVYCVEDGIVSMIRPFTGEKAGCDWWLDTDAINIVGQSGVIVYGEIEVNKDLKIGDEVKKGQMLGFVLRVLKNDKGRPMSMLHFAMHPHGIQSSKSEWKIGLEKPFNLIDPTLFLIKASNFRYNH